MLFVQACNMVANGHHSFFEAMLVASHLNYFVLTEQDRLLDFYLQTIPSSIQAQPGFAELMASSPIQSVLEAFTFLDRVRVDKTIT